MTNNSRMMLSHVSVGGCLHRGQAGWSWWCHWTQRQGWQTPTAQLSVWDFATESRGWQVHVGHEVSEGVACVDFRKRRNLKLFCPQPCNSYLNLILNESNRVKGKKQPWPTSGFGYNLSTQDFDFGLDLWLTEFQKIPDVLCARALGEKHLSFLIKFNQCFAWN